MIPRVLEHLGFDLIFISLFLIFVFVVVFMFVSSQLVSSVGLTALLFSFSNVAPLYSGLKSFLL